ERNELTTAINTLRKKGEAVDKLIKKSQDNNEEIKKLEVKHKKLSEEYDIISITQCSS
ncbi:hypothetical protein HY837_03235, partial [archaeon]|nr:hypothetical protein [archaeon]